jgi:hypothetical protein
MHMAQQMGNWYTWVVLLMFLGTAVFWISRLNKVPVQAVRMCCVSACQLP